MIYNPAFSDVVTPDDFSSFFQRHCPGYQPSDIKLLMKRYAILSGKNEGNIDFNSFVDIMNPIMEDPCSRPGHSESNTAISWLLLLSAAEIKSESEWQNMLTKPQWRNLEELFQKFDVSNDMQIDEADFQFACQQYGYRLDRMELLCLFRFFGALPSRVITMKRWMDRFQVSCNEWIPLRNDTKTLASIDQVERVWTKYLMSQVPRSGDYQQQPGPIDQNRTTTSSIDGLPSSATSTTYGNNSCINSTYQSEEQINLSSIGEDLTASQAAIRIVAPGNKSQESYCWKADKTPINDENSLPLQNLSSFECKTTPSGADTSREWQSSIVCNYCLNYPASTSEIQSAMTSINGTIVGPLQAEHSEIDQKSEVDDTIDEFSNKMGALDYEDCPSLDRLEPGCIPFETRLPGASESNALLEFLRHLIAISKQKLELKRNLAHKPGFSIDALFTILKDFPPFRR